MITFVSVTKEARSIPREEAGTWGKDRPICLG